MAFTSCWTEIIHIKSSLFKRLLRGCQHWFELTPGISLLIISKVLSCIYKDGSSTSLWHKKVWYKIRVINSDRKKTLIGATNDKINCRSKHWLIKPKRICLTNPVLHSYPNGFSVQSILLLFITYSWLSRNKRHVIS